MEQLDDLPIEYKLLAGRHKITNKEDISAIFPWSNTPQGHKFWAAVYTAEDEDELPDIPDIRYDSFKRKYFAYISIDAYRVMSNPPEEKVEGYANIWETTEGEYTYYAEPVRGNISHYYTTYFKPVVTIQHIIKRLDNE